MYRFIDGQDEKLRAAVHNGRHEDVVELLQQGANANGIYSDPDDWPPLFIAASRGHHDIVVTLLQHGANTHTGSLFDENVLEIARMAKRDDIALTLLKHGAYPDMGSVVGLQRSTIEFAIEKGGDVNETSAHGWTPLLLAVSNRLVGDVKLLLSHGANINAFCFDNEIGTNITALCGAAMYGNDTMVELLIGEGADVDARDEDGTTGLIAAAKVFHGSMAKMLLQRGANVEATDNDGNTALLMAADRGSLNGLRDIVPLYIEQTEDEELDDDETDLCAEYDAASIWLKENHPDIDEEAYSEWITASCEWPLGVLPLLVEHGANVNAQRHDGNTPLILASKKGELEMVLVLLANGANVELENKQGMTALRVACANGHAAIVYELLHYHVAQLNNYTDVPYWLVGDVSKPSRFAHWKELLRKRLGSKLCGQKLQW